MPFSPNNSKITYTHPVKTHKTGYSSTTQISVRSTTEHQTIITAQPYHTHIAQPNNTPTDRIPIISQTINKHLNLIMNQQEQTHKLT